MEMRGGSGQLTGNAGSGQEDKGDTDSDAQSEDVQNWWTGGHENSAFN